MSTWSTSSSQGCHLVFTELLEFSKCIEKSEIILQGHTVSIRWVNFYNKPVLSHKELVKIGQVPWEGANISIYEVERFSIWILCNRLEKLWHREQFISFTYCNKYNCSYCGAYIITLFDRKIYKYSTFYSSDLAWF